MRRTTLLTLALILATALAFTLLVVLAHVHPLAAGIPTSTPTRGHA